MISVIIPTLNEAQSLPTLLAGLQRQDQSQDARQSEQETPYGRPALRKREASVHRQ